MGEFYSIDDEFQDADRQKDRLWLSANASLKVIKNIMHFGSNTFFYYFSSTICFVYIISTNFLSLGNFD